MAETTRSRKTVTEEVVVTPPVVEEHWMKALWRPMMGWCYMVICMFDFVIGPVIYNVLQFHNPDQKVTMWHAITLEGGGLIHLSFGAILGIAAHSRGQEKMSGKD